MFEKLLHHYRPHNTSKNTVVFLFFLSLIFTCLRASIISIHYAINALASLLILASAMLPQLSFNVLSRFTRVQDISSVIQEIEKQLDVKFDCEAKLKTQQAQQEAEALMAQAHKFKEAGDIDLFLEVLTMANELKDASLYHAYKSAAYGYIREAQLLYDQLVIKPEPIKNRFNAARREFNDAQKKSTTDLCILSYLQSIQMAQDVIEACKEGIVK